MQASVEKLKQKIPLANQTVDKGFCLSFVSAILIVLIVLAVLIFLILIVLLIFLLIVLVLVVLIFFVFVVLISIHSSHPLFIISKIVLPLFICIYILILKSIFPKQKGSTHGRAPFNVYLLNVILCGTYSGPCSCGIWCFIVQSVV